MCTRFKGIYSDCFPCRSSDAGSNEGESTILALFLKNKDACQEGEAWGIIYIVKPNLSKLSDYPEFHDLDSIRWSVIGGGRLR